MKHALIEGTRIAQIVEQGTDFEVASPLFWVDVTDDTTVRDTYVNGAVIPSGTYLASSTVDEAHTRKKLSLANAFSNARDAGATVTISGSSIFIATTHNAQQELREVMTRLSGGGTQKGVTRSGAPVVFTETIAQQCLDAVNNHHGACNDNEYDHLVAILALNTIVEIDGYDVTIGWPGAT